MEARFTKGDWVAAIFKTGSKLHNACVYILGGGFEITHAPDAESNANLIAAAPEMYAEHSNQIEFLTKIIQMFPVNSKEAMEVSDRIDAIKLIQAKARGEQ